MAKIKKNPTQMIYNEVHPSSLGLIETEFLEEFWRGQELLRWHQQSIFNFQVELGDFIDSFDKNKKKIKSLHQVGSQPAV